VIRPLVYASEAELTELAQLKQFPIIPCDLCGSQDNLKRKQVKQLLTTLNAENPTVRANVFAALGNVRPSHLFDVELRRALGVDEAQEEPVAGAASNVIPLTALRR
jgi:outer membrane biosynthesis protein TonB